MWSWTWHWHSLSWSWLLLPSSFLDSRPGASQAATGKPRRRAQDGLVSAIKCPSHCSWIFTSLPPLCCVQMCGLTEWHFQMPSSGLWDNTCETEALIRCFTGLSLRAICLAFPTDFFSLYLEPLGVAPLMLVCLLSLLFGSRLWWKVWSYLSPYLKWNMICYCHVTSQEFLNPLWDFCLCVCCMSLDIKIFEAMFLSKA